LVAGGRVSLKFDCFGIHLMRLCVIFATEGGLNSAKLCVYSAKLCGKKCYR